MSLADLIVLSGNAAIEDAARKAGVELEIPLLREELTPLRSRRMLPHSVYWSRQQMDSEIITQKQKSYIAG